MKATRKVLLHCADEQACVQILDILAPFSPKSRELILATVAANPRYPMVVNGPTGMRAITVAAKARKGVAA